MQKSSSIPVLLIVFNRPDTTRRLIDALGKVHPTNIYVIADGARAGRFGEQEACEAVRKIIDEISWPCSLHKKYLEKNHGCDQTVETGLSWLFEHEETGIIFEDDCIPDPSFFMFTAEMLDRYRDNTHIMHINGSNFQNGATYGDGSYYFSKYSHSWGWATWRRAWQLYDHNLTSLPTFKKEKRINNILKSAREKRFWLSFFQKIYEGKFPFWDSRWTYAIWSHDAISITPNVNLIDNIGNGKTATHTNNETLLTGRAVTPLHEIHHPTSSEIQEGADAHTFNKYYYRSLWKKISYKINQIKKNKINTPSQIIWRLQRKVRVLRQKQIANSTDPAPSSYPYLSGDTFRSIADMVYDRRMDSVRPEAVTRGTVIFVEIEYVEVFFKTKHPHIAAPYVLITHNGDIRVDEKMARYVDNKILRWYAMSTLIKNEKIVPIPAGLENMSYYNNGVISFFKKYSKKIPIKKNRILFGFNIGTNRIERQKAYDFLSTSTISDSLKSWPSPKKYLKTLRDYAFVASPPGNAVEAHRTWEAMYLHTVPIVKKSVFVEYFKGLGMPLYVIDDWNELEKMDEVDLAKIYEKLKADFACPALYMDYWIKRIKNERNLS